MNDPRYLPYGRQTIEPDDIDAVVQVLKSDFLTSGPTIPRFEKALAEVVHAPHAVAVNSGTAALHAACFAARVGEDDEVIVPAVTFVASANCARYLGAEPVFADVDPDTGLILPGEVERLAGPRTRAVIPVHLTGTPADLTAIRATAADSGATVIEDATHALGGSFDEVPIGRPDPMGMAVFSFHPVKHIAAGEGGAVTLESAELLEWLRMFRDHGIARAPESLRSESPGPWYYEQQVLGHNLRMNEIEAALGLSQLKKLRRFVDRRRLLAARYDEALADLPSAKPVTSPELRADSAYHLYCVLIEFEQLGIRRADVMNSMRERGIGTQVHYIPLPLHPYYRERGWRMKDFPGAVRYYARTLSLPMFPAMALEDVDRVVETLRQTIEE